MPGYLVLQLCAFATTLSFGCVIMVLGHRERPHRVAATLQFGGAWWALCQLLWNQAASPQEAVIYHYLALPGFLFIGPLAMQLVQEVIERPSRRLRRAIPWCWLGSIAFFVVALSTDWLIRGMVKTSWGYGLVTGPAMIVFSLFTAGSLGLVIAEWRRALSVSTGDIRHAMGPKTVWATAMGIGAAVATDAVLPIFGIQWPRLGTCALAAIGAVLVWALDQYGYSTLSTQQISRRILRTLPEGVVVTGLNGRVRMCNDRFAALVGRTEASLRGEPLCEHIVASESFELLREMSQEELHVRTPSGASLPVSLSSSLFASRDEEGPAGFVFVFTDRREVEALRRQIATSDRLAAVGQLAAGIAHEINNPLAFVRANLSELSRGFAELKLEVAHERASSETVAEWPELIAEALEGVDRAVTIVRDIKDFSHTGNGVIERVLVADLIDQVLRVAAPQLTRSIQIERDYAPRLEVECEPQRIKQVLLNLVVNAAQAVGREGTIWIRTARAGDDVEISVEDDGMGIEPAIADRIFDPFFTTKAVGEGTGLGLSICHEIVRGHGGQMTVTAREAGGSRFTVLLPASAAEANA